MGDQDMNRIAKKMIDQYKTVRLYMINSRNLVEYAKKNKHYCLKHKRYIHLCRIDRCESWFECKAEIENAGYALVKDNRKDNPTGLRWKKVK